MLFRKCHEIFNFHQRWGRREFRITCFLEKAAPEFALQFYSALHMRFEVLTEACIPVDCVACVLYKTCSK